MDQAALDVRQFGLVAEAFDSDPLTGGVIVAGSAMSASAAAVDVTGVGSGLVTDVGTAGAEGLLVFGALFGIRVVIRAFSSAAG